MNKTEAGALLRAHLASYRKRSYAELVALLEQPQPVELQGVSGTEYQIEVQVFWNGRPGGDIRVMGSIDDGGWRAFVPLTEDFIMAPTGQFVGESR